MRFARICVVALGTIAFAGCGGGGDGGGGPVTVVPVLTTLTVTVATPRISVGGRTQVTGAPVDQTGKALTGVSFQYSSSSNAIATVDANGQVTGVAVGQATITVSGSKDGVTKSATGTVTVAGAPPTTAQVVASATADVFTPASTDVAVGGTVTWVFGAVIHNVIFSTAPGVPADIAQTSNTQVSRTFGVAGTFNYTCTLHANMNGTVVAR